MKIGVALLCSILAACAPLFFRADELRARRALDAHALQATLDEAAAEAASGNHASAAELYRDAIERNPRLPGKVYLQLAAELLAAGQPARAHAVARFAIARSASVSEPEELAASPRGVEALAAQFVSQQQPRLAADLQANLSNAPAP